MSALFDHHSLEGREGEEVEVDMLHNEWESAPSRKRKVSATAGEDEEGVEDEGESQLANDLINDDPIEGDVDGSDPVIGGPRRRRKKRHEDDDLPDILDDDDYDLIEENIGVRVQRKKKYKRLRRMDDDSDSDPEGALGGRGRDRDAIASQLFGGSDNEEERRAEPPTRRQEDRYDSEDSDGDYSETDDFIVDDEGLPLRTGRGSSGKKRQPRPRVTDAKVQEAQDIFGVDFNYDEFAMEGADVDEDDDGEKDGETAPETRRLKGITIREIYEPHELERAGLTEEDAKIRKHDMPERMQLRSIPVTPAESDELDEEAEWIYDNAFSKREVKPAAPDPVIPIPGAAKSTLTTAGQSGIWADDWDKQTVFPGPPRTTVPDRDVEDPVAEKLPPSSSSHAAAPATTTGFPRPAQTQVGEDNWEEENWESSAAKQKSGGDKPAEPEPIPREQLSEAFKKKMIPKIRKVLEFMRNMHFEVPFIAFFRKEFIYPDLNIKDLWAIYRWDAKFCQMRRRRGRLLELFLNMMSYQANEMDPVPESMRLITDEDLELVNAIKSPEELNDMQTFFNLYYSGEVAAMKEMLFRKRQEERGRGTTEDGTAGEGEGQTVPGKDDYPLPDDGQPKKENETKVKRRQGGGHYGMCKKVGIQAFLEKFGLSPQQFAQNLREGYKQHEVEQCDKDPLEAAGELCSLRLKTPQEVVDAAKVILAKQISREPIVRQTARKAFLQHATISCCPTQKGLLVIDETHPCFGMKYIKDKPVDAFKEDQFLKLFLAEEDLLLTISIGEKLTVAGSSDEYIEEAKQLFMRDEFRKTVEDWNTLRWECLDYAFEKLLFPQLRKELRAKLLEDAKEYVGTACSNKLYHYLKVAPFTVTFPDEFDDEEEWDTSNGLRILAIAYDPNYEETSYACLISPEGEPDGYVKVQSIVRSCKASAKTDKDKSSIPSVEQDDGKGISNSEKAKNDADLSALKDFIIARKPHLIVVGGESIDAVAIQTGIQKVIDEIVKEEDDFPAIGVEIVDNSLAKVYANSIKSSNDYREFPLLLKEAVSLGRRMQDPLIEFSQVCNADDEILNLRFHRLQDHVPKEELLEKLHLEFVNRTNEVGVDLNRAVSHPYTAGVVQFVCGLGSRKANAMLKILNQKNQRLESRSQLINLLQLGKKTYVNCSGFVKIDTDDLEDTGEAVVDVLDGARIHPETYEWARWMAIDALDAKGEAKATAVDEIMANPGEKLEDLDLDAFAVELDRQGFGDKTLTVYNIREELKEKYKDWRPAYVKPDVEELFNMLTKETGDTLYVGKLVTASVTGIAMKKVPQDELAVTAPLQDPKTKVLHCPNCKQEFKDGQEFWAHVDAGNCPGIPAGVRIRFNNGITGFIPNAKLSDSKVSNPAERVRPGQVIHCRILRIELDRFSVFCTSRSSDLLDVNGEYRPAKDEYYDQEKEDAEAKKDVDTGAQQGKQRQVYTKRAISHPSYKNICYGEAEKLMESMDQGEVIIRPSSKASDHLTVTWKVADGVYQHIDVVEQVKDKNTKPTFMIEKDEFEDFDEIIARFISPMASNARELLNYKYYVGSLGGCQYKAAEYLVEEKKKNPSKIHYILQASKDFPGKFLLSYMPRTKSAHEFVTVTPDGFRFRQRGFDSLDGLLKWFKDHYNEPPPNWVPGGTPRGFPGGMSTPHPSTNTGPVARNPGDPAQKLTPYTPSAPSPYIPSQNQMGTQFQASRVPPRAGPSGSGLFVHPGAMQTQLQFSSQHSIAGSSDSDSGVTSTVRKAVQAYARSYQQKAVQQSWPPVSRSMASGVGAQEDWESESWERSTPAIPVATPAAPQQRKPDQGGRRTWDSEENWD